MGTWGTGSFENDDALYFVVRLEHEGETAIRAALEDVTGLDARDYLEAPDASSAIAAGRGHWPKIGQVPLEMAPVPIPNEFMQDIGSGACQIVHDAFQHQAAKTERMRQIGAGSRVGPGAHCGAPS